MENKKQIKLLVISVVILIIGFLFCTAGIALKIENNFDNLVIKIWRNVMSKSAKSLFYFSLYLFVLGLILLLIPNVLLTLFKFPATNEVWIRVVGMLVLILGYYYLQSSKNEINKFFQWTVYARSAVLVFFIVFVLLGLAPTILILFGLIDAVAALWTQLSIRADKRA